MHFLPQDNVLKNEALLIADALWVTNDDSQSTSPRHALTKHTHTNLQTHTLLPLLILSTDREEYVQAALLMHIYTEHTLTHLLSRQSLKVIVYVCLSVRSRTRVFKRSLEAALATCLSCAKIVGLIWRHADKQPLLREHPAPKPKKKLLI